MDIGVIFGVGDGDPVTNVVGTCVGSDRVNDVSDQKEKRKANTEPQATYDARE